LFLGHSGAAFESRGRLEFDEQGRVCVGNCQYEASGNAAVSFKILKRKRTRSTGLKNRQVATAVEGDARELARVAALPFREGDCMTCIIPPLRKSARMSRRERMLFCLYSIKTVPSTEAPLKS
jgi:hypothetical protein